MTTGAVKVGLLPLLAGVLAIPLLAAPAAADTQAAGARRAQPAATAPSDGYKTAIRLGGSRSLYYRCRPLGSERAQERCLGTRAQLQKAGKDPRFQKDLSRLMDDMGMTAQTAEVIRLLSEAPTDVQEVDFEIGRTMQWMGLWDNRLRPARPGHVQMIRWGGKKPFKAWQFSIDDGKQLYTYVVPKECGNLGLASTGESPKAKAADEERRRREQEEAARKAADDERRRKEEEERRRREEEERRQAELRREPVCAVTASASYLKGVWTFAVDGSGSASGAPAAASMTVQIVDAAGAPVSVTYNGAAATELKLTPPFRADASARKLKPGVYTVKAVTSRDNNVAPPKSCEASVTLEQPKSDIGFFLQGAGGKQRRVYETELASGSGTFFTGYCDGLVGVKGGPTFRVGDAWQIAPALGVAINVEDSSRSSVFGEVEFNRLLSKGYIGTGIGVWDFAHSDSVAASWLLHFGVQVWENPNNPSQKLYFVGEGRLFLNEIDDASNNYQFWGGLRYAFR